MSDGSRETERAAEGDTTESGRSHPLWTDLESIVAAVVEAEADAFVAVGDRFDTDLRYLTRFAGADRPDALVVAPEAHLGGDAADRQIGHAALCVPRRLRERAEREFVTRARLDGPAGDKAVDEDSDAAASRPFHDRVAREVRTDRAGDHVGERAAAVVHDLLGSHANDRTLLVPASIPHGAAVYLEQAGNELASTDAVATARSQKTDAEIGRLRQVQHAAATGIARAETVLAESEVDDADGSARDGPDRRPALCWNGAVLTADRLKRAVNVALAAEGVGDAGDTAIASGRSVTDDRHAGDDPVRPGETVVVSVSPRGPDGYRGNVTRTFVVDGDGGWERRASVAVEAAREAALAEVESGVPVAAVGDEVTAELAAYGFDPNFGSGESEITREAVHGVGLRRHEAPSASRETALQSGHSIAVKPGVCDPDVGGVYVGDLVVVTDSGYELLADPPLGITPEAR